MDDYRVLLSKRGKVERAPSGLSRKDERRARAAARAKAAAA